MAAPAGAGSTGPGTELLERRLRQAMERGELVVHYQPRVDAVTQRLVAVEALVRWNHPQLGLIGPAAFVPLAERTGLIAELGARVLDRACADAARWHRAGVPISVSVNVSPRQLELQDLPAVVVRALERSGLEARALELEITEGVRLSDDAAVTEDLARIHALGVVCAVDDFGKGYSLLAVLRDVPVQVIKIDQSCMAGIAAGRHVVAFVEMAKSLGIRVVAEGIEDEGQRALAAAAGCDEVQGYLVSRAVPASRITRVIGDRHGGLEDWPSVCPVFRDLDERTLAQLLRQGEGGRPARKVTRRRGAPRPLSICVGPTRQPDGSSYRSSRSLAAPGRGSSSRTTGGA